MQVQPLGDRVLVKPLEETVKKGGIIIPDTAKEKPQKGEVIAVAQGKEAENLEVKAGDKVLFGKYAGTEITVNGEEHLILSASDILAIVKD
ncbi:MAG: co-chaperone GroES [Candidatus Coatesbacteria bacterium]|nr:co-chaperone GroES [Candidatus Coatesbacteria bacterium]